MIATHRPDLAAAIERATAALGKPGTWLSGFERAAVAQEARAARSCRLCAERKAARSPAAVTGHHAAVADLDPTALEMVHRLVTDSPRLTKSWFEARRSAVGEERYVEIVGVTAVTVVIDTLARTLGGSRPTVPAIRDGEPSGRRPSGTGRRHAWVATVDPDRAEGDIARLYGDDDVATVVEALTLSPSIAVEFWRLVTPMYLKPDEPAHARLTTGWLTRPQVEYLASRVSARNECFY